MTSTELTKQLRMLSAHYGKRLFRLKELAVLAGESAPSVGMTLIRAARAGIVSRVGNYWINMLEPPTLEEVALALKPVSYVSFESVLYKSGALSQSPRGGLSLATTGRSARIRTPLGDITYTHIAKPIFFGFNDRREALPEKAFLDLIYIRMRRGTFKEMTEVLYPDVLDPHRLRQFARRFPGYVRAALQFNKS